MSTKPKLIILSDLWGKSNSQWVSFYENKLSTEFDIKYYDCCELGDVDISNFIQNNLHHQFINGGIEKAVDNLLDLEKDPVNILAFSIGGSIAWKAGLEGLSILNLYAVSSSRLRYEIDKPWANINLFYGDKDNYIPSFDWFEKLKLHPTIFEQAKHELYMDADYADKILDSILS